MNNDEATLAKLFSLARKKDTYGAMAQRLADSRTDVARDISSYSSTLKNVDADRTVDRDKLHFSYGL